MSLSWHTFPGTATPGERECNERFIRQAGGSPHYQGNRGNESGNGRGVQPSKAESAIFDTGKPETVSAITASFTSFSIPVRTASLPEEIS